MQCQWSGIIVKCVFIECKKCVLLNLYDSPVPGDLWVRRSSCDAGKGDRLISVSSSIERLLGYRQDRRDCGIKHMINISLSSTFTSNLSFIRDYVITHTVHTEHKVLYIAATLRSHSHHKLGISTMAAVLYRFLIRCMLQLRGGMLHAAQTAIPGIMLADKGDFFLRVP